ncbi:MAG: FkbM family methyltransferase [Oscillospiraceae bacterium]|jgi:FkbM family methyltransferase|nr:FkbM family methyltransferase [Oscillospiraceae bacterium]
MNNYNNEYENILRERKSVIENLFGDIFQISKKYSSVVLYGGGENCCKVLNICEQYNVKIDAICDKYKSGNLYGVNVISPSELCNDYKQSLVIITCIANTAQVRNELNTLGFNLNNTIACPYNINWLMLPDDFMNTYFDGYKYTFDVFGDEHSKNVILARTRLYLLGEFPKQTSKLPIEMSMYYFDAEFFDFGEREIFVQAGCYDGETVKGFINFRNNVPADLIYTFESEYTMYKKCCNDLSEYPNVIVCNKGLWSEQTELDFFSDGGTGGSSFVRKQYGEVIKIPVTSLDIFFENKEPPTFIQFDIEGAEKEALLGARNIISKYKPKLAVSIYHKPEDLYELVKTILDINKNYSMLLEHCYDNNPHETVLFCK